MRRATLDDVKAVGKIVLRTLRAAWPDRNFDTETVRTFVERAQLPGAIVCVTDAVDAFILTDRHNKMLWEVCFLMPFDMTAQTGKGLIGFAFQQEHKARPFVADVVDAGGNIITPGTVCIADLSLGGANIEAATADAYKIALNTDEDDITDTTGAVRIKRVHLTASQVASRFGVVL